VYTSAAMNAFEIFLQKNKVTGQDWQRFTKKISDYESEFRVEVVFEENNVGFYLYSQKDLSHIADRLEGFILKPTSRHSTARTSFRAHKRLHLKLPAHKNILEFRENEAIKKQRNIEIIIINFKKIIKTNIHLITVLLKDKEGNKFYSSYLSLANPLPSFEFDFKSNLKVKKKSLSPFLKLDEVAKLFNTNEQEAILKVSGFPYFSHQVYLPLTGFDFGKHGLIVGQTGVGKTKFLELFVKKMAKQSYDKDYVIVVIDPHATLYPHFLNIDRSKINFDFIRSSCDLFPAFSEPKIATELTILLFKTLLKDQFQAKMERVLKYTLYVLFLQNRMSLNNLRKFLTELEFRKELLESLDQEQDYLVHFFGTEFVEFQTKFYEIAIMPVLVLIDELNFIPAFSNYSSSNNLESALKDNFLVSFSLNRIFLGEKATRLIAGLIIQQLFLIAQKDSFNKKIVLIIDEVSIVENESLINILAEARKFNLSVFLSQQYLTQITSDLLRGILSNVFNYFTFKVSDEDAKILAKNLDITFPDEILTAEKKKGLSEEDLKRNLLVTLNPRECVVRVFKNSKFYPCFKAKTMDVN